MPCIARCRAKVARESCKRKKRSKKPLGDYYAGTGTGIAMVTLI
jgi:hypothetical protein